MGLLNVKKSCVHKEEGNLSEMRCPNGKTCFRERPWENTLSLTMGDLWQGSVGNTGFLALVSLSDFNWQKVEENLLLESLLVWLPLALKCFLLVNILFTP